jgi:hypothetical protein
VRRRWPWFLAVALVLAAGVTLVHRCADGAMGARYGTGECRGTEWVQYDRSAADGPRRTLCLGRVGSTTWYRSRGAEIVSCP